MNRVALCFTPDAAFFPPAVRAIALLVSTGDADAFDIFIVCEPADVLPGLDQLDVALRSRITLLTHDFAAHDGGLQPKGRFSRAVFRRLFLDKLLPKRYERYVAIDSDMLFARPGLARLADLDLGGHAFAAAYDMIYLMDLKGDALSREFQASRRALGLDLDTPYFNAGLMVVDRAAWRASGWPEEAARLLRETPERFAFMEQDALNSLVRGRFAPLSPRYNFMGDFLLTGLEAEIAPVVLHFVTEQKPWAYDIWQGDGAFARAYSDWFAHSPWPNWAAPPGAAALRRGPPPATETSRRFAQALRGFLAQQPFIDA